MPSPRDKSGQCPLCQRECALTFHHLIPRKMHRRTYFRKHYSREQLNQGIAICRACHNGIHKTYDEMQLAKHFHNLASLQQDPTLARHFQWVARQKISQ